MAVIAKSFCTAFLMYSRIPVPKVKWCKENRRYALCFFPCIGMVIGLLYLGFVKICLYYGIPSLFQAVGSLLIPFIVTGGIHMDGYLDVCDAKACMGDKEKRFEVMKDSHIGAFAVIHFVFLTLIGLASFAEVKETKVAAMIGICYFLSRSYSALFAVTLKNAKGEGSLMTFTSASHKRITIITQIVWIILGNACLVWLNPWVGSLLFLAQLLISLYYYCFSRKWFGGITGDLAGYFVTVFETALPFLVVAIGGLNGFYHWW